MNQYVNVSLSLIGLCALVGAGVAVGSGVGMMALQAGQLAEQESKSKVVAHTPAEKKVSLSHGFAASGAQQ